MRAKLEDMDVRCMTEHPGFEAVCLNEYVLETVWFPSMDKLFETKVKSCLACQIATPVMTREPLKMFRLPDQPWEELSAFCRI